MLAATVIGGLIGVPAAHAISGGDTVAADAMPFTAKIDVGDAYADPATARSCSGALIDPWWVITASSCFATGTGTVSPGRPPRPTTATIGRADLTSTAGHVLEIDRLTPHPNRNIVLARLVEPVRDIAPVRVGTAAPVAGDQLRVAGYGRTATDWVPDRLRSATFSVTAVGAGRLDIEDSAGGAGICKGDAGGPALRQGTAGLELVAVHDASWQGGCLGVTETRRGAVEVRVDDLAAWIDQNSPVPTEPRQLALTANRVGLLRGDGRAQVKEGAGLSTAWTTVHTGARQLVLAGDRIGVLTDNGTALVKEGGLSTAWTTVYTGARQLVLDGDRIGVLTNGGVALVKEGSLHTAWVTEYTGARDLVLAGDRIGILNTNGVALVKEGSLHTAWINEFTGARQLRLAGDRIGVLTTDWVALVKQGSVHATWVTM